MPDMRLGDRRDHRDMRPHQPRQRRNLARVVHADLGHTETRVQRYPSQRKRHAPMIVIGRHRRMSGTEHRQRPTQHFLRRGLPHAAGHRDHPPLEPSPREPAKPGQPRQRVIDPQHRPAIRTPIMHHRPGRTAPERIRHKRVPVAPVPNQRHEQIPRRQRPRIDRHPIRAKRLG